VVTDEMAKEMEEEYKEQIKLQGKPVPMTVEEEYRNADVPDEVLSKNLDNDFIKHLKNFFKGEK
jgi:hypothetical protein